MSTEHESRETPPKSKRKFKAEVRQVLDIVIHSLYTHREIFIRELISNASDALEKMRHKALTAGDHLDKDVPYEIKIATDKDAHTFIITDTGIGMTFGELNDNLGTIARSGTREFIEQARDAQKLDTELIGKFGVGFYSAFMAASEVRVKTRSYEPESKGYEWVSDGLGEYTITEAEGLPRGTSITLMLKEDAREYENAETVRNTIKKYSNFVTFPIFLNGDRVNTIQAIWLKSAPEVKDEEYNEFYKFISNSEEEPLTRLHLKSDAPIQLSALLYVPLSNLEKFGFFKLKSSLNLYCRKVLIEQHTEKLLPEYMRFVTGVVDSEDLPLNISRETLQDNAVFRKLGKFLTGRVIKHLNEIGKSDSEKYRTIWETFGMFIKEGTVSDFENQKEMVPLLRFESSREEKGKLVSLTDYTGRMKEGQNSIFYLNGRSREEIENGPYIGTFRKQDIEVLYLYEPIDDFVMTTLQEDGGKKLVSADSADIELPGEKGDGKDGKEKTSFVSENLKEFIVWMKEQLGDRVTEVRESKRAMDRPAIIVNPDAMFTTTMHRVMKAAGREMGFGGKKILEINPDHEMISSLKKMYDAGTDREFLKSCVNLVYDNSQAEAGLLEDPKVMVDRVYQVMGRALKTTVQK